MTKSNTCTINICDKYVKQNISDMLLKINIDIYL